MTGPDVFTVNDTPLLACPLTVTTTFPVDAPAGTGTTMVFALQYAGLALTPLKVTALPHCSDPKFVPVIVTGAPTPAEFGDRLVICCAELTPASKSMTVVRSNTAQLSAHKC